MRQVDASNHGSRVRKDKRRYLYRVFLDYVSAFRPRVFVMENVLGIQSAAKGKFFTRVQAESRALGYRVQAQVEESWKLGVPQSRRRQLIIGVRNDIPGYFPGELAPAKRALPQPAFSPLAGGNVSVGGGPKLWDAIGDLPPLAAGAGLEECDYDLELRGAHLATRGEGAQHYLNTVLEIDRAPKLTGHRARPHNEQDLRDFARLRQGEHSGEAEARGEKMEFTYKRSCFKDRYKRQDGEGLCSTIVAHLSKDGLGFIHPTQNRSLTPREAARIQSFPDWFQFPPIRTHSFRLIGNAVPPLVAEAVGEEIIEFLATKAETVPGLKMSCMDSVRQHPLAEVGGQGQLHLVSDADGGQPVLFPGSEPQAVEWLRPLLDIESPKELRRIANEPFQRAWRAIAFLYAGLHPDAALDHGESISRHSEQDYEAVRLLEPRLLAPYYERSGWPVVLAPIAREAWRRYRKGYLTEDEFYCSEAQMAGMRHRSTAQHQPPMASATAACS